MRDRNSQTLNYYNLYVFLPYQLGENIRGELTDILSSLNIRSFGLLFFQRRNHQIFRRSTKALR